MSPATRRTKAAVVAIAAAALSGCSQLPQGDHRWIKNSKEGMFTRIPKDWTTYVIDPYAIDTERPAPLRRRTGTWQMILDSTPRKKKLNALELKADRAKTQQRLEETFPSRLIGEMSVIPISSDFELGSASDVTVEPEGATRKPGDPRFTLREELNISLMRNYAFFELGENERDAFFDRLDSIGDPVKAFIRGDERFEVVKYDEDFREDGLHGVSLRMNFEVSPNRWTTVDQQILVDRSYSKVYRLMLKCESSCFKRNYREAKRIAANWRVTK